MTEELKQYKAVKSIICLYKLANILCVAPIFDFMKNECRASRIHKYYCIIMCVVSVTLTIYSLNGRIVTTYPNVPTLLIFMDAFALIVSSTTNIIMIVRLTIYKQSEFQNLIGSLIQFDNKSNITLLEKPGWNFYLKMALYHVFLLMFFASDTFLWCHRVGFEILRFYLSRYLQYYQLMTFSFLICNYANLIRDRFMHLNNMLLESVSLTNKIYILQEFVDVRTRTTKCNKIEENCVKRIGALYTSLCDIVELFNEIFGFTLLVMGITIIIGLLEPLNIALIYAKTGHNFGDRTMGVDLVIVCVLWTLLFMICAVMIALPCDQAKKEGARTSYLSYKLMNDLMFCNKQQNIKDDLIVLGQYSFEHSPNFNADGFFNVDHGFLSNILAAVTSYLIVLIQLA